MHLGTGWIVHIGTGWIILIVAVAVLLLLYLFLTVADSGLAAREKQRFAAEARALIARNNLGGDRRAILNLERAQNLAHQAGDGLLASEAGLHLGDRYMLLGQYADAAREYEQALQFKEKLGWSQERPNFEALLQRHLSDAQQKARDNGQLP
jgi:tetratricopeptide (TPR) repeat protein